jgi:Peptidase family M23
MRIRLIRSVAAAIACPLLAACTAAPPSAAPPSTPPSATTPSLVPPDVPPGGIDPATRFTPLTASTLNTPSPVTGTDGKIHLAYELVLSNLTATTVRLDELDVVDAASRQALLSLAGTQLTASSNLVGGPTGDEGVTDPSAPGTSIPSSASAIVWLDVAVAGPPPARLAHRLMSTILPPNGSPTAVDATAAEISVNPAPAVVLGPPLQGGEWYASDGCCADDTHHRRGLAPINGQMLVAQRFAIDWFLLDEQHRTWVGDPAKITNYLSYDKPALAAADGAVVDALDGLPETTSLPQPPPIPPITETVGNHVTLMIAPGVYILYAHFKPGTVAVKRGQQVKRGDVVGHIGSSGNSSTPHLHFQVMTAGTFFPTDSPPFVFDCFDLTGQITERIWDDNIGLQPTNVLPHAPAPDPGRRSNQMPLDRNVVRFTC